MEDTSGFTVCCRKLPHLTYVIEGHIKEISDFGKKKFGERKLIEMPQGKLLPRWFIQQGSILMQRSTSGQVV